MAESCHIRIQKQKILARWEYLSRQKLPAAADKSRTAILDHLPELFDALCEVLETKILEKPKEISKIHGRQRFSFGSYTLAQVIDEYALLKDVIFDEISAEGKASFEEFRLIGRFFDAAMATASTEFATLRENEIKRTAKNLEASHSDLERFVAVAAHDLRSPAATIVSYAELALAEAGNLTALPVNPVDTIRKISLRMIQLIDQLLVYTKIGNSDVVKKSFSLFAAAEAAKMSLTNQILEAQAEVLIESLPDYYGDQVLFSQLFQNLIANSLKFKAAERKCRILISYEEDQSFLRLRIKDNGIGFDPEMSQEIFEPFKRGVNHQNIKGSGLGLATVKKIVELHGGRIHAMGRLDAGVEIHIELPLSGTDKNPES